MDPMSIVYPVLSVGGIGVVFGACEPGVQG